MKTVLSPSDGPTEAGEANMRILMSVDAVGGVWRYAMDLATTLVREGFSFVFVGFGPRPGAWQRAEAERLGQLFWLDAPLDWTTQDERPLNVIPHCIAALVDSYDVDIVHLNLPSQAAGLNLPVPTVVVSHSCVVTWFDTVRDAPLPDEWSWQQRRNQAGFEAATHVIAPSAAHAAALRRCYGELANLSIVHNGARALPAMTQKDEVVLAAGRWWDEGKNARTLDAAAVASQWPVVMVGPVEGPGGERVEIVNADYRGELPHAQLLPMMSRAGIVCSASIYEPFGLAALEGASARAALVLSDIPTYRELWDGAALFVDPRDAGALADAINRLAGDALLRNACGEKAFQRSQRYSLARQGKAFTDLYRSLAARPAARTA